MVGPNQNRMHPGMNKLGPNINKITPNQQNMQKSPAGNQGPNKIPGNSPQSQNKPGTQPTNNKMPPPTQTPNKGKPSGDSAPSTPSDVKPENKSPEKTPPHAPGSGPQGNVQRPQGGNPYQGNQRGPQGNPHQGNQRPPGNFQQGNQRGSNQGNSQQGNQMQGNQFGNQGGMKRRHDGRAFVGGNRGRGGYQNQGGRQQQNTNMDQSSNKESEQEENENPDEDDDVVPPQVEKKFTGRCRLFVGNLPNDTKEEDFKKMFDPFGELSEVYVNVMRGFGFVRLDTRIHAEQAKAALDGLTKKGRVLRVRFATHGAALKVKNLTPFVSNELLEEAFSMFGTIERTVVIVDDRGKPTGEGIVEFARKPGAQQALTRINEGCFFLGQTLRPIVVEPLEQKDEEDGLPEKFITRNQPYMKERELQPRFAQRGSFEYEFGMKWKDLYHLEEDQRNQLQRQIEDQRARLEMEMGAAQIEHQAKLLHQDYLRKQEELKQMEERHQQEMQRRMDMRQQEEEMRRAQEDRRRQEMLARQQQEEEMRRRQQESRRQHDAQMFGGHGGPNMMRERGDESREMRGDRSAPLQPPPTPPVLNVDRSRNNMGVAGGVDNGQMEPGMRRGAAGTEEEMGAGNNAQQRQSRFDQPPATMGRFNAMGGPPGQGMGGRGGMGRPGQGMGGGGGASGGGNMEGSNMGGRPVSGGMGSGRPPMNQERMLPQPPQQPPPPQEATEGSEEFAYENKRPRRY